MELLLNLAWAVLALIAFWGLLRERSTCEWTSRVPYLKALLALACVLILLFPVVSASDDLHPTQAVLEDANKRIHQFVAPLQSAHDSTPTRILPALLATCLLGCLLAAQQRNPEPMSARSIVRERVPRDGRAPPSC